MLWKISTQVIIFLIILGVLITMVFVIITWWKGYKGNMYDFSAHNNSISPSLLLSKRKANIVTNDAMIDQDEKNSLVLFSVDSPSLWKNYHKFDESLHTLIDPIQVLNLQSLQKYETKSIQVDTKYYGKVQSLILQQSHEIVIPQNDINQFINCAFHKPFSKLKESSKFFGGKFKICNPGAVFIPSTKNIALCYRVLFSRREFGDSEPIPFIKMRGLYSHFGQSQSCPLIVENIKYMVSDEEQSTLQFDLDSAKTWGVIPSFIIGYNPSLIFHPGLEDVRLFVVQTTNAINGQTVSQLIGVGNIGSFDTGKRSMVLVSQNKGIHPPLISPIGDEFDKNWMPIIGKDGFAFKESQCMGDLDADHRVLFMHSFAPTTIVSASIDPSREEPSILMATLKPSQPSILKSLHLSTQVVWCKSLNAYVSAFHRKQDWLNFAFATYADDGPGGSPGTRLGTTPWCNVLKNLSNQTKQSSIHSQIRTTIEICYPTSLTCISQLSEDFLVLGIGINDIHATFVTIPASFVALHIQPQTGAPSPW